MCVWCVKNKKPPQKTHTLEPTLKIGAPLPHAITLDSNTAKEKKKKKKSHQAPAFKKDSIQALSNFPVLWVVYISVHTDGWKKACVSLHSSHASNLKRTSRITFWCGLGLIVLNRGVSVGALCKDIKCLKRMKRPCYPSTHQNSKPHQHAVPDCKPSLAQRVLFWNGRW